MRIFILPTSDRGLGDQIMTETEAPYPGGMQPMPFLGGLAQALKNMGHEVHTTDFWSREKSDPTDILVVQDHPGYGLLWRVFYYLKHFKERGGFPLARQKFLYDNYRFFKRRILIHAESPMITPYVYRNLEALTRSGIYQRMMFTWRGRGEDFEYFNLYDYREQSIITSHFSDPKDKFLILLNSNARPRSLFRELYGERLKAIRYFSAVPGFDLYGGGWNRRPRHPLYPHYKKYVDRAWRGRAGDKMETMSKYKFAICYENASYEGYITEKIYDCLACGTIPIYLGAPDIDEIVPADCFIDFRKFKGYAELHAHLLSLTEKDLTKYRENIFRFLNDKSTMKGMKALAEKVLGV